MPRVRMIEEIERAAPGQKEAFEHIIATRGRMLRPYAAMLHRPEIARAASDMGSIIRSGGILSDREREVVIVTTVVERACEFEIEAHSQLAVSAGVPPDTLESVLDKYAVQDVSDALLVEFARQLCRSDGVADDTFDAVLARFGEEGAVEVTATVGYYSMLSLIMNALNVC